jgi:hypothetical protein
MSIICAVGLAFGVAVEYLYLSDQLAAGHNATALIPNLSLLAAGAVIYVIVKFVRRAQGIDVNLVFKQLPIE